MASHNSLNKIEASDKNTLPELRSKPAAGCPVTDQPDPDAKDQGKIYVQVTVLSKKLGTKEDGTIIINSLSDSLVSYPRSHHRYYIPLIPYLWLDTVMQCEEILLKPLLSTDFP